MSNKSTYPSIKALIISAIVISLTACSSGTDNSQSASDSDSASNTQTTEQTTEAPDTNAAPIATAPTSVEEVPKPQKVEFEKSYEATTGFVDVVNGTAKFKLNVAQTEPIVIQGWAVTPDYQQPADMVLITLKNDNTIISTAKVDAERKDVADELKQPATLNSGWDVQIDPATLPSDQVELQAWGYDSKTQKAYPLNNSFEITRQ
ncbi:hypothetical protein PCC7424_2897 [Gloeothece citriformis PCC 7424]|uniref:Lipoprotein n=1 Tax=Gloeothece citriformis (strain PCC 7424) TaxID=65393 RepID=B7K9U6_GLOC7|nr:hypothetical protein [Gloeothece citriformis]ACK71302.1 hypothetical protein PCC7424_2897 [Gloeothece citriformis PCC 7424]